MAAKSPEIARAGPLLPARWRAWAGGVLLIYILVVLYLTLVWHPGPRRPPEPRLNLRPFATTVEFLRKGGREMLINVVGNLGLLAPLGLFASCLRRGRVHQIRASHVVLLCGAASLAIECLQYLSGWRIADVDDVILNTLGGLLGYLAGRGFLALATARRGLSSPPPIS